MSQKRVSEEGRENSSSPEEKRQRVPALKNVFAEAMKMHAIQKFFSALEPVLRRVVKEEVERALEKHFTSKPRTCNQIHPSSSRCLQLQFANKLSLPIFTGTRIEGEDCPAITIALVDALTGQPVVSGPESSMRVEIVVLEGDFDGDEEEWTWEEFKNNLVREREGKRSLLLGDVFLNLSEGIGAMGELVFTDNSSWTRSRKFRLGARVETGYFDGMRVREAKTESFMVKDHRGELYKKHYPPSLSDEVWRLEKIGKDGAFHKRLNSGNVHTVKDFLTILCTDAQRLRNILGNGMSAKMWEVTVDHARTCILNSQLHAYYYPTAQCRMGLLFNVIGEPVGILSERQYIPMDEIPKTQKEDVQNLVKMAYENWGEVVPYNNGAVTDNSVQLPTTLTEADNPCSSFSSYHKLGGFDFIQPRESSPDIVSSILSVGGARNLDYPLGFGFNSDSHGGVPIDDMYKHSELELSRITNSLIHGGESDTQAFCEEQLQYLEAASSSLLQSESLNALESQSELGSVVSSFLAKSAASHAKAQTAWMTLRAVFRWKFSIRRIVASKRAK